MTQYVSVAQIRSDVFFIMLHHASKFEITILFHTSLVEDIIKRRLLNNTGLLRMLGKFGFTNLYWSPHVTS